MKLLFTIFSIFCSIYSFSQNLVPNPSFEEKNPLPYQVRVSSRGWYGANGGPGDYYYRNNTDKSSDVPVNLFGKQEPHTGNAYTAICIESEFAEYIEAEFG